MALNPPDLEDEDGATVSSGVYDDLVVVLGGVGEVTAGATVNLYWDAVKAWDAEDQEGLINSTEAKSSGKYEVWFDVPEATAGDHYVWVKDMDTGDTASVAFTIIPMVDPDSSSGQDGDRVDLEGYGFDDNKDLAILLVDTTSPDGTNVAGETVVSSPDGSETEFDFDLDNTPIEPGSVVIYDTVETFTDDGDGDLTGDQGGDGTVNYVTGEVEVEFNSAPFSYATVDADYEYFEDVDDETYIFSTAVDTDGLGSFTKTIIIPDQAEMDYGSYYLYVYDSDNNEATEDFDIGAVIELDVDEGPTGTVVEVRGRGFDNTQDIGDVANEVVITDGSTDIWCWIDDAPVDVESDGDFKLDIVIPTVDDLDDFDTIVVTDGVYTAEADFEVTGDAEVEMDPEYGLQGETIVLEGWNFTQISGEDVEVTIDGTDVDDYETDSDGEFDETFTVPAKTSGAYELRAEQADYNIYAEEDFRIGLMIVIVSPDDGPTGTLVTLTGAGFSENMSWNATFDGEELWEEEDVNAEGEIEEAGEIPSFYVPTVEPGIYTITVLDIDTEIEVEVEFEVTESTYVTTDPEMAPNDYNVSIEGWYFMELEGGELEFVIYNATDDWDMEVYQMWDHDDDDDTDNERRDAELNEDGNFTAYWKVPDDETLSLGEYTINITDEEDLMAQIAFSVVEETISIEARKASFAVGETVSFVIESSFTQHESYIEIMDPDGDLYWETDELTDGSGGTLDLWLKVGVLQIVPYYRQTAGGNPMLLLDDAPLGEWSWVYYDDDDDELDSGTFTVVAAPEAVLEERMGELSEDLTGLSEDVSDLAGEISGVKTDVAGVKSDVAAAKAAADAAKSAADSAADAVSDVADTASAAKTAADAAKSSSDAAKTAADEAKSAASGLSTLVYGAIGASLIAALAAIVSLMQISRRIAG
jgi:hypothetical protein